MLSKDLLSLCEEYIFYCGTREMLCVPEHFCRYAAAESVQISQEKASYLLRENCGIGTLRPLTIEGHGRKIYFQCTPRGAHYVGNNVPLFLRSGLKEDAKRRALMRATAVLSAPFDLLNWFGFLACDEFLKAKNCQVSGYARVQIAQKNDGSFEIVCPILPTEDETQTIKSTCLRLLNLLDYTTDCTLRFMCVNQNHDRVAEALSRLKTSPRQKIESEVAKIDAEISADKTGLKEIQLSRMRKNMVERLAETPKENLYPWLASAPLLCQ